MFDFINELQIPTDNTPNIEAYNDWDKLCYVIKEIGIPEFSYHNYPEGFRNNTLLSILEYITWIATLTKRVHLYRYSSSTNDFYAYASFKENYAGLIICVAPKTRFDENKLDNPKYMEGVENLIRAHSNQFLKVFTVDRNDCLYVYTNTDLDVSAIYQLLLLQEDMLIKKEPEVDRTAYDFIKALSSYNIENIRKEISDFLNSDYVKEKHFEKFKETFSHDVKARIRRLNSSIEENRRRIADYEHQIYDLISKIREQNDQLAFLKYRPVEDNTEQLYNYLNKHPYIADYTCRNGQIIFNYIAPLIYFSEAPAERFIENDDADPDYRAIVKAIIDGRYQLYTQSQLVFDAKTMTTTVNTIGTGNYLGHPHLDRFHCFGNHSNILAETAEQGDYLGYIEELSQAVLNLNFYDGCVIESMCQTLLGHIGRKTWKDTETGEMLSTKEILERSENEEA